MKRCIFCDIEYEREQGHILSESANFYVEPVIFGPFSPGHVILISKFHIRCFGEMDSQYKNEFYKIKDHTLQMLTDSFSKPILGELGIYGQSVKHAHIHFFPSASRHYLIKEIIKNVPENVSVTEIDGFEDLKEIFNREKQYVYIEEANKKYVCNTKDNHGKYLRIRILFSK